jgi:hypothetical protein
MIASSGRENLGVHERALEHRGGRIHGAAYATEPAQEPGATRLARVPSYSSAPCGQCLDIAVLIVVLIKPNVNYRGVSVRHDRQNGPHGRAGILPQPAAEGVVQHVRQLRRLRRRRFAVDADPALRQFVAVDRGLAFRTTWRRLRIEFVRKPVVGRPQPERAVHRRPERLVLRCRTAFMPPGSADRRYSDCS